MDANQATLSPTACAVVGSAWRGNWCRSASNHAFDERHGACALTGKKPGMPAARRYQSARCLPGNTMLVRQR